MKTFLLLIVLCLSTIGFTQSPNKSYVGLSYGIEEGQDFASITSKIISETNQVEFTFSSNKVPESTHKENVYARIKSFDGVISINDKGKVSLLVSNAISEENLKSSLLFLSRLNGYIGFKIAK
ncbi:MAG TPA: hypothetical protein PLI97_07770 [Fluviicola sp.]|nr:hypothetical protein [Fluviicola sp.]